MALIALPTIIAATIKRDPFILKSLENIAAATECRSLADLSRR
jgi:hypothetical protein